MPDTASLGAAREVLEFWFAAKGVGSPRIEWFRKDPKFDAEIRRRFGELHASAAEGALNAWRASPEPMLALVIVLDQFSRNLYRNDARAYAQDEMARSCAGEAIQRGDDLGFIPVQRQFLYMPFEHSEDLDDQNRGILLFSRLGDEDQVLYARKHRDVIEQFGRFPHRNAILGRAPRADEVAAGDVFPW
jgi:uncharacterized protein (DUF924 family)